MTSSVFLRALRGEILFVDELIEQADTYATINTEDLTLLRPLAKVTTQDFTPIT